jgi:hypothetical protein
MQPSSWRIYGIKNWQKLIRCEKVTAPPPPSKWVIFTKQVSIEQLIAYFQSSQKILKYYSVAFRNMICRA